MTAHYGGAEVIILPASEGTGVVAGGAMRAVLDSVGIKDVLAKSKGSSNPHNLVKATIAALSNMRDARTVAKQSRLFHWIKYSEDNSTMATIKVKQIKSRIHAPKDQKSTLEHWA